MLVHKKCHKITGPCGKDYSDITTDSGEVNNSSIQISLLNSVVYVTKWRLLIVLFMSVL